MCWDQHLMGPGVVSGTLTAISKWTVEKEARRTSTLMPFNTRVLLDVTDWRGDLHEEPWDSSHFYWTSCRHQYKYYGKKKTTRKWVTNSLILLCWWITKYLLTCRKLSPKGWQARCADWLTIRCKSCLCTWILENLILPATGQSYAPRSTDSPWPHQSWIKYVFLQAPGRRCTAMMISSSNI